VLDKVKKQGVALNSLCDVSTGIMGGCDYINNRNIKYCSEKEIASNNIQFKDGVFVLDKTNPNDQLVLALLNGSRFAKDFFKNSDIQKYYTASKTNKKIIFSSPNNGAIDDHKIRQHLDKFKAILMEIRRINNERLDSYPYLRRGAAHSHIFEAAKIVAPQRSKTNAFGFNDYAWYASADVYFITEKKIPGQAQLKYILALLNSTLYYFWLYHRGKRKGEMLELYQTPLSEIPIRMISDPEQNSFIELVDKILAITTNKHYLLKSSQQIEVTAIQNQIDQMVFDLYGLSNAERDLVLSTSKAI
jgi:adenine-specific DNA-methyltransferase